MNEFTPPRFAGGETWLDEEHVLEPVEPRDVQGLGQDPLVSDAEGRLWRIRRRPLWASPARWAMALRSLTAAFVRPPAGD